MKNPIIDRGRNITYLQQNLLKNMDGEDASRLISKAKELVERLPDLDATNQSVNGLILGLIQSGKTAALTTSIALAADNGYRMFVVLTTDNNWLYDQTFDRLQNDLQILWLERKTNLEGILFWPNQLASNGPGMVLVVSKNQAKLRELNQALQGLKGLMGGSLPNVLIVDDEADQASLDTQTSKRAKRPNTPPGRINDLITQIRNQFSTCTYLQVTATPQALFLQDKGNKYRPEFTILIEPGKGYIGGNTFFSLEWGKAEELIRYVQQSELDELLGQGAAPTSLRRALATFFVGATIKCILANSTEQEKFSFLCHISQKISDHNKAYDAIRAYQQEILDAIVNRGPKLAVVEAEFKATYDDLIQTLRSPTPPSFEKVFEEFSQFVNGMEIQVLHSEKEEDSPKYNRRYNILIGGTKLARGVTIPNLIVTYYGRQARTTNMDTVLQHARMYGYREPHLDVTRLFLTSEIENRFQIINESEQGLRNVIENYPNEDYRVIRIAKGLNSTRRNVLNPNNKGYFGAGSAAFPHKPIFKQEGVGSSTELIDGELQAFSSDPRSRAVEISIDRAIDIISLTQSEPNGGGVWDTLRVVAALETLKRIPQYGNRAYLVVRKDRDIGRNYDTNTVRAVLGGNEENQLAVKEYPTLFMFRLTGSKDKNWDGVPFWIPILRFPGGRFALEFNVSA